MNLYVWEHCFRDHNPGLAVAIASSIIEARELIANEFGFWPQDLLERAPDVYPLDKLIAFAVYGGS